MVKPWLKKIFRAEVAGVVIAVIGLMLALPQFQKDALAELTIRKQTSEDNPTVQITDNQTDALAKILPILTNTSKYSLNNFSLQYRFTNLPANFVASDDYTVKTVNGTAIMTYNSNTLYAHATAPMPIQSINTENESQSIDYTITYTFDGAPEIGEIKGSISLEKVTINNINKPLANKSIESLFKNSTDTHDNVANPNDSLTKVIKEESSWLTFFKVMGLLMSPILLFFIISFIPINKNKNIKDIINSEKFPEWIIYVFMSLVCIYWGLGLWYIDCC